MGRNLEFDSRVLELNSRFQPKASLPLCLGYSLPKKENKFLTKALSTVAMKQPTRTNEQETIHVRSDTSLESYLLTPDSSGRFLKRES